MRELFVTAVQCPRGGCLKQSDDLVLFPLGRRFAFSLVVKNMSEERKLSHSSDVIENNTPRSSYGIRLRVSISTDMTL